MKEFTIGGNDAGQRLDRWLAKTLPLLPAPLAQKYIRLKRVKVNGKGSARDVRLKQGDLLQLYINDEFFETPTRENTFLTVFKPQLTIVYEDENILLLDKPSGMVVHPDKEERVNTLLTHLQAYLYQKKEWSPYKERSFAPALCNRIDRNTGGIVIAAKNAAALREMNQKIKERTLSKRYLAIVHGAPSPAAGELRGYLSKDEAKNQVSISKQAGEKSKLAVTRYCTLAVQNGLALVECELVTGRTHQIRALFAHAGHPLLGDRKYGRPSDRQKYGAEHQALYAYKLSFPLEGTDGVLAGLAGKTFTVERVDFAEKWFPSISLEQIGEIH
ncbi:MAG: RluA family pseudouridine synthase [Oscillospiraceae bacterium]|nr:RluA family pseudouridine synthase [Oscillospiraceae bacterium]